MKTLIVLRHAKSCWKDETLTDHERPLNDRGERDAPRMGQLLRNEDLVPDFAVISTARRAVDTAERVLEAAGFGGDVRTSTELYHASPREMIEVIRVVPDRAATVLLVGHNPGCAGLVWVMTGVAEAMPTAAIAHIALPIDSWARLSADVDGTLEALWRPKELAD